MLGVMPGLICAVQRGVPARAARSLGTRCGASRESREHVAIFERELFGATPTLLPGVCASNGFAAALGIGVVVCLAAGWPSAKGRGGGMAPESSSASQGGTLAAPPWENLSGRVFGSREGKGFHGHAVTGSTDHGTRSVPPPDSLLVYSSTCCARISLGG